MVYRLVITPEQKQDQNISLTLQQQHYLLRVLRLQNGDRFVALDGLGQSWLAQINGKMAIAIKTLDISTELPAAITLITALPKGSGYEQVLRCCTELGVSTFIPIISDRTIVKPSSNKVQRWRKIVTEAAEQSERQIVPTVLEPVKFSVAMENTTNSKSDKYIAVARGKLPALVNSLANSRNSEIVIATGCEGGWTNLEVEQAIAAGYQPVSLGKRILRAVTAPIVALSLAVGALE